MTDDPMIKKMTLKMLGKCTKYWHECYEILAVGAILNPRLKFGAIRFAYTKIDLSTCEKMIIALRKKIEKLFDECVKVKSSESNASTSQQISPPPPQVSYMDDEQVIDALGVSWLNCLKYFLYFI